MALDRHDMFPHIEDRLSMTVREWLMFHLTMHRHYTTYLGRKFVKTPNDIVVLGDIIESTKPQLIIEIGSFDGGSALWMAHLLDNMNAPGEIVSIDIHDRAVNIKHPRITWLVGDSTDPDVLSRVDEVADGRQGMVIEDSDHHYLVTKKILDLYWKYVAPDCYFLVEDTIVDFLQVPPFPGPLKAVKEFIAQHDDKFVIDRTREKYIVTHNPMGYLLRRGD